MRIWRRPNGDVLHLPINVNPNAYVNLSTAMGFPGDGWVMDPGYHVHAAVGRTFAYCVSFGTAAPVAGFGSHRDAEDYIQFLEGLRRD